MNVIKCLNGHFFDGDLYVTCPHCGAQAITASANVCKEDKSSKPKFFDLFKDKGRSEKNLSTISGSKVARYEGIVDNKVPTVSNSDQLEPYKSFDKKESSDICDKTLDFWQVSQTDNNNETSEAPIRNNTDYNVHRNQQQIEIKEEIKQNISQEPQVSLTDVIKNVSANSEGKTMSYFSSMTDKTDTQTNRTIVTDPVVGWMVAISGNHLGQSFQISAGRNSIGRNSDNKIVLDNDNSISRSKHAVVTYEPKKRNFYIQPGDSSGLTYLNDEYITETKQINDRDIIEIGDSKLMLVTLCSEDFTWEDYINKE